VTLGQAISDTGFLPSSFTWPGIPWAVEPFEFLGREKMIELHFAEHEPESPSVQSSLRSSVPLQNPQTPSVDPSQVVMIDNEDSFSPSEWSDQRYTLQWSLVYEGRVISGDSLAGITPREAYARTNQIGFATRARRVPGHTVTYDFVSYGTNGFFYNGWSATATIVDPWGIQSGALQTRINLQNQGVIPAGVNLQMGGGLSSYLYNQLPGSIQYNGYYYAVPTDY